MRRANPIVPLPRPVSQVMDTDTLGGLQARLARSRSCLDACTALLPPALVRQLQPGPWDDAGWTLIAPNPAVGAKLRQWLPTLEAELQQRGLSASVRLHIVPGAAARPPTRPR